MLHRASDALALHPLHEGHGHARREQGVFGVALEVTPSERVPLQVHRRPEQHLRAFALRLLTQCATDLEDELGVPCGAERAAHRKARGRGAALAVASGPVGSVGDLEGGNPETFAAAI